LTRAPNHSRRKGSRVEREIVQRHTEMHVLARRVPLSGASDYTHGADVDIYPWGEEQGALVAEVKARKTLPKVWTQWLGENDLLFIKQDREAPFVVMPWDTYARLVK